MFNLSEEPRTIGVSLKELQIDREVALRDLWKRQDLSKTKDQIKAEIPPHGAVLYKLSKQ